jgi:hypothetical protein
VRTPNPMAIEVGVVRPYKAQRAHGIQLLLRGKGILDNRAPIPRPSKDW